MARPNRRRDSLEDDHEPRRRSRDRNDRPRRRKGGNGSLLWWILGVGGVAAVLVVVLVIVIPRGGDPIVDNSPVPPGDKKPIDNAPAPVAWRYIPDAAASKALTDARMPLAEDPHHVLEIAFSGHEAAQAAVAYEGEKGTTNAIRPVNVDRFDLVAGKRLGTVELFRRPSSRPGLGGVPKPEVGNEWGFRLALSPEGGRVAFQQENQNEINILDLDAKRLIHKWPTAPAGQAAPRGWLGFPDKDHVLYWDGNELVRWAVADGKEKYRVKDVRGYPELSPTRKHVAFRTGRGIELADAASGQILGLIANEEEPFYGHMPMTFSRDGKELLVGAVSRLYHEVQVKFAFAPKDQPPDGNDFERDLQTGALNICRRDLVRNAWIDKTRAALGPGPARFLEGGFLGQGWCLYPTGKLLPLVRYEAKPPLLIAAASPDGRLWTVEPMAEGQVFGPRPFVNGAAKGVLARLEKGDIRPAIPYGTGVRVVVMATSDGLKRSLAYAAGASLVNSGLKPDESGGFTLRIDAKEVASGLWVPYVQPGVGSENAAHRTIELRATLTDKAGKAVFYAATTANPPRTLTFQRGKASEALAGEVQASAASWAGRLNIPPTKHFINGELVDLPLTVPFTENAQAPRGN